MQSNNFNHASQDGFFVLKLSRVLPSKEAFKDGKELKKKRQIEKRVKLIQLTKVKPKRFSLSHVSVSSIDSEKCVKLTGNVFMRVFILWKAMMSKNKYLFGLIEKKRCPKMSNRKVNTFVYNVHLENGNCVRVHVQEDFL